MKEKLRRQLTCEIFQKTQLLRRFSKRLSLLGVKQGFFPTSKQIEETLFPDLNIRGWRRNNPHMSNKRNESGCETAGPGRCGFRIFHCFKYRAGFERIEHSFFKNCCFLILSIHLQIIKHLKKTDNNSLTCETYQITYVRQSIQNSGCVSWR